MPHINTRSPEAITLSLDGSGAAFAELLRHAADEVAAKEAQGYELEHIAIGENHHHMSSWVDMYFTPPMPPRRSNR